MSGGRVIHEYVNRVVFQTTGRQNVRGARRDVDSVKQSVDQLDAKLLAAGFAFQQFAKNAIQSFGEIESALAKFASRAGWELTKFRKETEQETHNIARLTGVKHSLILQAVQEGISQGSLQGMEVPEILQMVKDGAKLHAAQQTDILSAVSSAITSRQYGAPSAPWGMRLIYSASQVGAGNPAEYGKEYKDIAPGLNFLNVEQSEGLGALALIAGAAPSLAEGATWIKALLRTISNPQDDARAMFEERTGMTFTAFQDMFSERGGMVKALTLLAENFHGPEIVGFFGRQEAAQGFAALTKVPGQLLRLQQAVRANAIDDPVERAWQDNVDVWRIEMARFRRSMDTFLRSFGAPYVAFMKAATRVASRILDALTTLNDALGGLPAILVGLTGALVLVRASVNAFNATMAGLRAAGLLSAGGVADALFGPFAGSSAERREREEFRDARDRANRGYNTAAESAVDAGIAAVSSHYLGERMGRKGKRKRGKVEDTPWFDRVYDWVNTQKEDMNYWDRRFRQQFARGMGVRPEEPNWRFYDGSDRARFWRSDEAQGWWKSGEYSNWRGRNRYGFRNFGFPRNEDFVDSTTMSGMGFPPWVTDMFVAAGVVSDTDFVDRDQRKGKFNQWWDHNRHARGGARRAADWADRFTEAVMNIGSATKARYAATSPQAIAGILATAMGVAVVEGFKWWYKKLDATGLGDLSSTKVAQRAFMLRSNAFDILSNKDSTMRNVEMLGDIDGAILKGRVLGSKVDEAGEELRGMYRDLFSLKEGTGAGLLRGFAKIQSDKKMLDAQNQYSENLFALAGKVKQMEIAFPNRSETRAWRAYLDQEIAKGGSALERFVRYVLQDFHFAHLLPDSWTKNPATEGQADFWHLPMTEDFMENYGHALASQGIGVLSDQLKAQHAWAKDPQLKAALDYVDANRQAEEERKAALESHYKMIRDNPGIKVEINIGTLSEASVEEVKVAVEDSIRGAYRSWADHNDGQIY